jgi:Tfp pilus assembly protein PilO
MVEKLANLGWSRVLMIGLGLAIAIYFLNGSDSAAYDRQKAAAQKDLESEERQLEETKKAAADIEQFKKDNKKLEEQLKELVNYVPTKLNPIEIVGDLTTEINKSGATLVKMGSFSRAAEHVDFYEMSKIDFAARGTYAQLVQFLAQLTQLQRLFTFDKMELAGEQNGSGTINLTATLVAYRYAGDSDAGAAKDGNEKAPPKTN